MEIISLSCPNCGAPVSTRQNNCEYCQSPVIITSFTNIADMPLPQVRRLIQENIGRESGQPGPESVYRHLLPEAEDVRKGICLIRKSDGR